MFDDKSREELVTLTEREDMAVSLGKELAAFLLEEHVAAEPGQGGPPRHAPRAVRSAASQASRHRRRRGRAARTCLGGR